MTVYRIMLVIAVVAASLLTYPYLRIVTAGNPYGDSLFLLAFAAAAWIVVVAAILLKRRGHPIAAIFVLLLVVLPALLAAIGLFLLNFVFTGAILH